MCRKRSDVRDQFWNRLRRSRKTIWAACKCRVGGRRITNRCGLDSRRIRKGRGNRLLAIWIHSFASRLTPATLAALPCMSLVPLAPFRSALESLVREVCQSCAHLVYPPLHGVANMCRQRIKGFGECWRPNLEGSGHDLLWLPRRVLPGRNFAAGLIELCFNVIG